VLSTYAMPKSSIGARSHQVVRGRSFTRSKIDRDQRGGQARVSAGGKAMRRAAGVSVPAVTAARCAAEKKSMGPDVNGPAPREAGPSRRRNGGSVPTLPPPAHYFFAFLSLKTQLPS